jgi:hypothetical protein
LEFLALLLDKCTIPTWRKLETFGIAQRGADSNQQISQSKKALALRELHNVH